MMDEVANTLQELLQSGALKVDAVDPIKGAHYMPTAEGRVHFTHDAEVEADCVICQRLGFVE